jgi:hypothetical protein
VVSVYDRLSRHHVYDELDAHDFDEHRRQHLVRRPTRRMERSLYRTTLGPVADA